MFLLIAFAPTPTPAPSATTAPATDPLDDARQMYKRGAASFSAADYNRAIEVWTDLLSTLPAGGDFDAIRLDLLFNIAIAHDREYGLDHDARHLRQALTLFERYTEAKPDGDAEANIVAIQAKLAALEEQQRADDEHSAPQPNPDGQASPPADNPTSSRKLRGLGIGLLAGGGLSLGGGIALVVVGARFKPSAQDAVAVLDTMNVPDDHASRTSAEEFLASETSRGRSLMAGGGAVMAVGAAAVGVGIWALIRAKQTASPATASLHLLPTRGGVVLGGQF